jgi:hypothetical protein
MVANERGRRRREKNFERRGREGFAKGAKKKIQKKSQKINTFYIFNVSAVFFGVLIFSSFLSLFFVFFCVLCESFAPSAFKNSSVLKELISF